jgi:hypothetical protein
MGWKMPAVGQFIKPHIIAEEDQWWEVGQDVASQAFQPD